MYKAIIKPTLSILLTSIIISGCNSGTGTENTTSKANTSQKTTNASLQGVLQCHYATGAYKKPNTANIEVKGTLEKQNNFEYFLANNMMNSYIKYCDGISEGAWLDGLGIKVNNTNYPIVYKDVSNSIQDNSSPLLWEVSVLRNLNQMLSLTDHPEQFEQYKKDYNREDIFLLIDDKNTPLRDLKEVKLHVEKKSDIFNSVPVDYETATSKLKDYLLDNIANINVEQAKLASEFITRYDQQAGMPALLYNLSTSMQYNQQKTGTARRLQILVEPTTNDGITLTYRYAYAVQGLVLDLNDLQNTTAPFIISAQLPIHLNWKNKTETQISATLNATPFSELDLFASKVGNFDSVTPLKDDLINSFVLNSFNSQFYLTDKSYTTTDTFAIQD